MNDVGDEQLQEQGVKRHVCTKEHPFRPGVDDDTQSVWVHEDAQLDQQDMFWTCPNCKMSWQEMYQDI